jgi:H+-translocating NAD(P) transhydrogenase subunit beta
MEILINFSYLIASSFFILGLKLLSSPKSARKGNFISAIAMAIAVIATLINKEIISYQWIMISILIGSFIGIVWAKKVKMTQMPEMVALLNGAGGFASLLVGWAIYIANPNISSFIAFTIFLSVLIGGVTFSGSFLAWGKLCEKMKLIPSRSVIFPLQKSLSFSLLSSIILSGIFFSIHPTIFYSLLIFSICGSILLGIFSVLPIGGADMPVVISLLNSYSGLAACSSGFVIQNNVLIVAGALVGASGIILTTIMCKAMNRSIINVLFSGFGSNNKSNTTKILNKKYRSLSPKDAYFVLEAARSVVIVPGYGMAVAQAQHVVKELTKALEKNGCDVKCAIHPVAGRMPGHMNVLLAEANIDYDMLYEMDDINSIIDDVDVCLVIGANDVVNPSARDDETSSIYGMPIIEADRAKNVFVLKRSMKTGFAGIENPLFYKENSSMIFGDAKSTLQSLVAEF